METFTFIESPEDLYQSLLEFNKATSYYRELVGNSPRYFVHTIINGKHLFGLSKFCAFKDITVGEYINPFRYATDGGTTQKHIASKTGKEWIHFSNTDESLKLAFNNWIHSFFPNYNTKNANFITITIGSEVRRKKIVSPDELTSILEQKSKVGRVGEEIAYNYECDRLKKLGAAKPQNHITHTALTDVNAGFDIFSDYNKTSRLIEVKSTINGNGDLYLTRNEMRNFELNPSKAFIYVVHITDLANKKGFVVKEINNLEDLGILEPVLYKVTK